MFGLGNSVRAPSLKLYHRFRREPRLIRLARISFRFRQCLMAKYRHYLVGGTPCPQRAAGQRPCEGHAADNRAGDRRQ